jgi:predicted outer membrane protein
MGVWGLVAGLGLTGTSRAAGEPSGPEAETLALWRLHRAAQLGSEAGRLAASRATREDLRELGTRMAEDQSRAEDELAAYASGQAIRLDRAPVSAKDRRAARAGRRLMDRLRAASGPRFDGLFLKASVMMHSRALAVLDGVLAQSPDRELRELLDELRPLWASQLEAAESASAVLTRR